jgi:hypothetical protein
MTVDVREQVLARTAHLIGTVPGIVQSGRNAGDVTGRRRPAIIQDDGSEEPVDGDAGDRGGSRNSLVQRNRISVAFRILLEEAKPANIGTSANDLRVALLKTFYGDDTLLGLLGVQNSQSTRIKYAGCALETGEGEAREGTMTVNMELTYVFRLADVLG